VAQPMFGIWAMAGMALGLLWQQYMAGDIEPPPRGGLTPTDQWGNPLSNEEHIISRRSSRDMPNLLDQGVFEKELTVFFQSVIRGKEKLSRVSKAKRGEDRNLAYVPVYWFFDRGEVEGVGFNVHVNRGGGLSPGSMWIVGVEKMSADSYSLTKVDFYQVIAKISQSSLKEEFEEEVKSAKYYEEQKHKRSEDKWSRLGEKRGVNNKNNN